MNVLGYGGFKHDDCTSIIAKQDIIRDKLNIYSTLSLGRMSAPSHTDTSYVAQVGGNNVKQQQQVTLTSHVEGVGFPNRIVSCI